MAEQELKKSGMYGETPEIKIGKYTISQMFEGDCVEKMKNIPDCSIDLTVTSPPYSDIREYKGFSWNVVDVAKELFRVTKSGGIVVWVIGDKVRNGSEEMTPFHHAFTFVKTGFRLHDTMIYQKNAMPFPEKTRYIQCFEYMFIFSKGKPKTVNLIQEATKGHKTSKSSSQRNKDGTTTKLKYEQGKKTRNRWNVWKYEVGYNKTTADKFAFDHPAMFPEKLAHDHITSWSNEGDTVLDPFMGANTTGKMAKQLSRNFIGIELDKEYFKIAKKRLNNS